jgi:hypothetical protein
MIVFSSEKRIVGLIENVIIHPANLAFTAKMDTGARHSSLDVSHIVEFERGGVPWVRFEVVNNKGQKRTIEAEISRNALIKRHKRNSIRRYVIKLGICLGNVYREVEVNLTDRTGFNYRMLIGRSFMQDAFIVAPSLRFTTQPDCKKARKD